jgi:hypothetical protein
MSLLVYSFFSFKLLKVAREFIDSFSKKIIATYFSGYLVKTMLWFTVAIDLQTHVEVDDKHIIQFIQGELEEVIELLF